MVLPVRRTRRMGEARGMDGPVNNDCERGLPGSDVEIKDVPADKGYHSTEAVTWCQSLGIRTCMPERENR